LRFEIRRNSYITDGYLIHIAKRFWRKIAKTVTPQRGITNPAARYRETAESRSRHVTPPRAREAKETR
jgi:hypothetical protein